MWLYLYPGCNKDYLLIFYYVCNKVSLSAMQGAYKMYNNNVVTSIAYLVLISGMLDWIKGIQSKYV